MTTAATTAPEPFITLYRGPCIVLFWTGGYHGPGYSQLPYGNGTLEDYLEKLWNKFRQLQSLLNERFAKLDKEKPENSRNRQILRMFQGVGAWAYAAACELLPYLRHYDECPTNKLYVEYVYRLEEIYTKCFMAMYLYGIPDERIVGLRGLLTDFELTGGITRTGEPNKEGIWATETNYYIACVGPNPCAPRMYEGYGDLMEALGQLLLDKYPLVAPALADRIEDRRNCPTTGFGNTAIISPAKIRLLDRLHCLIEKLRIDPEVKAAT